MSAAVFLDRDGILNELVVDPRSGLPESPLDPAEVSLVAGASAALARIAADGYLLVGASNQPAAAKGFATLEQLAAVQARVVELLEQEGVTFAQFRVCWHHPEAVVAELAGPCDCRKPEPGMLLAAIRELSIDPARSWMIGDSDADVFAARAAGVRSVLVENPSSDHRRTAGVRADATVSDIGAAAAVVVGGRG
jgi:D-glycero-D-manno-heptose 1,7-bisphosphate phosphatase